MFITNTINIWKTFVLQIKLMWCNQQSHVAQPMYRNMQENKTGNDIIERTPTERQGQ